MKNSVFYSHKKNPLEIMEIFENNHNYYAMIQKHVS